VNVVALLLVFIGACAGFGAPLNAVQMLWVNLVMDTFGALALGTQILMLFYVITKSLSAGTESPASELLERKPYKRTASLISIPMWRNILVQSTFQLVLLITLLYTGPALFGVESTGLCKGKYIYFIIILSSRSKLLRVSMSNRH
jgi:magnesium-transporting ATPase (P-type)